MTERKKQAILAEGAFAAEHFARHGVDRGSVFALLDRYASLYDNMGEVVLPTASGPVKAACKKGCALCCHTIILLTAPEAFYLADFIERTRSPEAFAALVEAVRSADRVTRGKAGPERWSAGGPCALLDTREGACSVYGGRPLACRGAYSASLQACESAFAERATNPLAKGLPAFIFQNADVFIYALAIGLKSTGRPLFKLELNAALTTIWSQDRAFDRWVGGEGIFSEALAPGDTAPLV